MSHSPSRLPAQSSAGRELSRPKDSTSILGTMSEITTIGVALLGGLAAIAAGGIAVVIVTPLPWWGGLLLVPAADGLLLLWARRRLKAAANRGRPSAPPR